VDDSIKALAIANCQKSLAQNPKNSNAVLWLEEPGAK
jgi:hypothetical protein